MTRLKLIGGALAALVVVVSHAVPAQEWPNRPVKVVVPFAAPPGVPTERVAVLRRAFDATLEDAEFLADAAKAQLEIEPLTAAEIDGLLATAYGTPKPIVQKAAALVEPSVRAP